MQRQIKIRATISSPQSSVIVGNSVQLKANLNPSNAANKQMKWKAIVQDEELIPYVTLTTNGKLTVNKNFPIDSNCRQITVQVTALGADTEVTDTISIDVVSAITSIELYKDEESDPLNLKTKGTLWLGQADEMTLSATVLPSTACQTVKWSSSNSKIATVDENGNVKGLKAGTVVIKATSCDGKNKSVSYTIIVK